MRANVVDFVDYGADCGVFVNKDFGDYFLIGEVFVSEVEMG